MGFTAVDLSQLKAPGVIDEPSFEAILTGMLTELQARDPEFSALVESDPAYKILQVAAFRELLLRQRVNEAARAVMLAFAAEADLDQIGANYSVARLVLDPGDPNAVPPVPPTFESDDDFRRRIQLSPEAYTTAGSAGSYVFNALGADPQVRDAQAVSPSPGVVTVYIQSRSGDGSAGVDLVEAVEAALNAETVRPMTDSVNVQSVSVIAYPLEAELIVFPGPDAEVIRQRAEQAATAYVRAQERIGFDVTRSGLFAALHREGVQNVDLISPAADIVVGDGEVTFCEGVTVTVGGTSV
jgi:phage-related baseplate assembly protein